MPLIDRATLVAELVPPLDATLASKMLDEFISLERRFVLRDWEPAELDGGQFCEILARIFYHLDSGNLSLTRSVDDCLSYLENDATPHQINPRHNALHPARVIRTAYKFRSQRGAVHISPTYEANHMDAKFIIEAVRWLMNETLRLFWRGDREKVAAAVREILQFEAPCVGRFEDAILVQRTDLSADEEVLVLLHYAGESGFTRKELGQFAQFSPPAITSSLQRLTSPQSRQVIQVAKGRYRLTDLGEKRVREQLAEKLLLQ